MSKFTSLAAVCAALVGSSAAHATLIDFNELHNTSDVMFVTSPYVSSGYVFTNDCGRPAQCFATFGTNFPIQSWLTDPAGASLMPNFPLTTTTLARVDGAAFNLQSMDLADGVNEGLSPIDHGTQYVAAKLIFTFQYAAGGSSTQSLTLDSLVGMQTVNFAKTGLSSVSWVNVDNDSGIGFAQFDNVVVTAAVPEPGTWALMLGGLGALGAAARRRNRA